MLDVPERASTINHVTMHHVDVINASLFVQKIFSMPIITYQDKAINPVFGVGPDLVPALGSAPQRNGTNAMISHFCFGVKYYDPNTLIDKMKDAGFTPGGMGPAKPLTVMAPATPSGEKGPDGKPLVQSGFVFDPDGNQVQISHVKFCAGFGPIGAVCEGR